MSDDHHDDDSIDSTPAAAQVAAARLLDESAAGEDISQLSLVERRRVADLQWLHSLLQQTLHRDAVARDRRITRACLAIRDDAARQVQPAAAPPRRRSRWLVPGLVAAARIVVAILLRGPATHPSQLASAAVETTLQAAKSGTDRMYRVETQWRPIGENPAATLVGDLWVRGNTHYLLRQQSVLGEIYIGSNGDEHWFAGPLGPVFVGDQPRRFEQLALGDPVASPYLQVTSLLEQLADRYDSMLAEEEELPAAEDTGTVRCMHVVGHKRNASDRSPDVIELWTARQSGLAYRIRVKWNDVRPGPQQMQLQLMPLAVPLPTDWYDHASHHAAERRVIRRPGSAAIDSEQ